MSDEPDIKESSSFIDLLERSITEEHFKYYEYSDFKNLQLIGEGLIGNVKRANCKDGNQLVALKSFNNDKVTLKEIVNEVRILQLF